MQNKAFSWPTSKFEPSLRGNPHLKGNLELFRNWVASYYYWSKKDFKAIKDVKKSSLEETGPNCEHKFVWTDNLADEYWEQSKEIKKIGQQNFISVFYFLGRDTDWAY